MKRFITLSILALSATFIGLSCEKRCDLAEGVDSGAIIHTVDDNKVVVYPKSGYLTDNSFVIYEGHMYDDRFEVSFDGGRNRQPLDFSLYNVIANPKVVKCDVSFDREVTIDNANQTVTYTVKATECDNGCDEQRRAENWVLVPKFPATYFYYMN